MTWEENEQTLCNCERGIIRHLAGIPEGPNERFQMSLGNDSNSYTIQFHLNLIVFVILNSPPERKGSVLSCHIPILRIIFLEK